jgi:hypothetical protein
MFVIRNGRFLLYMLTFCSKWVWILQGRIVGGDHSKHAETTAWFVGAAYSHNKQEFLHNYLEA